jgi:hypothetical protein
MSLTCGASPTIKHEVKAIVHRRGRVFTSYAIVEE